MATPLDFMERVVAWPADDEAGYVNLHWLPPEDPTQPKKKGGMRGRAYRGLDNFMSMAAWCASNPERVAHTYFCLSTQPPGKELHGKRYTVRSTQTAIKLKAIWLDIDVKPEGYPTTEAALGGLGEFIAAAGLPTPSALVLSGSGGLHVYWISDRPLTVAEWRPYAEGLKVEALKHGLKCDAGLTTDAARVLRVPGTFNYKITPPRAVTLKHLGPDYDFAASPLAKLDVVGRQAPVVLPAGNKIETFDLSGFPPPPPQFATIPDNLTAALRDDTPLDPEGLILHCPHFGKLCSTHGAGEPQGVWMLDVLACTFLEDGGRMAHYVSNGYVGYDRGSTDEMYWRKLADKERGIGWPSCKSFEDQGCKECATCPLRGKIRSPLNKASRPKGAAPTMARVTVTPKSVAPFLPDDYAEINGIICKMVPRKGEGGEVFDYPVPMFRCEVADFQAYTGTRPEDHSLSFKVRVDLDNWENVRVPETEMYTFKNVTDCLSMQRVKLHEDGTKYVGPFMVSLLQKMDAVMKRQVTVPYGWHYVAGEPAAFAYGGKLFMLDGTERDAGYADRVIENVFSPKGKPEPWYEAVNMITAQSRPGLEAVVALSFGGPLMMISGLYNGIYVYRSPGTAAHKTTATHVALAVWGSPHKAKETISTTENSLLRKLGTLSNIPVYLDEINDKSKFPQIAETLRMTTEGSGKGRLASDLSQRERDTWETMMGMGTNEDFWEFLKSRHKNSDAIFQRVLQVEIPPAAGANNQLAVQQLIKSLDHNYGHAGLIYAKWIAVNYPHVKKWTTDLINEFGAEVNRRDGERFREATVCCMIAGAHFANQALGTNFHVDGIRAYLKEKFLQTRTMIDQMSVVAGSKDHVEAVMDHFLTTLGGNTVWTQHMPGGRGRATEEVATHGPRPDTPIFIRCVTGERKIIFKKQTFEEFCGLPGNDYAVGETLKALGMRYGAKAVRATVARGTQYPAGAQVNCIELPVPNKDSPFWDHLFTHSSPDQIPQDGPVSAESPGPEKTLVGPISGLITAMLPVSAIGPTGASAPG